MHATYEPFGVITYEYWLQMKGKSWLGLQVLQAGQYQSITYIYINCFNHMFADGLPCTAYITVWISAVCLIGIDIYPF